jgi:hypothetical protein
MIRAIALGETQRRCLWIPQAAIRLQRRLLVNTGNDNQNILSAQLRDYETTLPHLQGRMMSTLLERWLYSKSGYNKFARNHASTTTSHEEDDDDKDCKSENVKQPTKSRHHRCICQCLRGVVATACQAIRGLSPWVLHNPSRQHESHLTLPEPPTHLD